jgi:hypothetical protein
MYQRDPRAVRPDPINSCQSFAHVTSFAIGSLPWRTANERSGNQGSEWYESVGADGWTREWELKADCVAMCSVGLSDGIEHLEVVPWTCWVSEFSNLLAANSRSVPQSRQDVGRQCWRCYDHKRRSHNSVTSRGFPSCCKPNQSIIPVHCSSDCFIGANPRFLGNSTRQGSWRRNHLGRVDRFGTLASCERARQE